MCCFDMSLNFLVYNERHAHEGDIFSITRTSKCIVSTSSDASIKYWDLTTNECTQTIDHALPLGGHGLAAAITEDTVVGVSFSGQVVDFSTSPSRSILPSKVKSNDHDDDDDDDEQNRRLRAECDWCVALSPDAATVATSTSDGTLNVYDRASATLVASIPTRRQHGMAIDYAPDNRSIATGHIGGGLFIFDTEAGKLRHSIATTTHGTVRTLRFSPNSELLASAGDAGIVALHDVRTGEHVAAMTTTTTTTSSSSSGGGPAAVTALDWNASGELLATASVDGRIRIWHVARRECVGTFTENVGHKLWAIQWARMGPSRVEGFVVGGSQRLLRFYLPTST